MSQTLDNPIQYSATVALWLDCFDLGRIPLVQVASTFVIAAIVHNLPPCEARVVMSVDGREYSRSVRLINGMQNSREAMILSSDEISPF